jgi:hypothetical protein
MKNIPIIFSAPMVNGLIREARGAGDGKTQTRRVAWRDALFGLQDYASEQLEEIELKGWDAVGEGNEGLLRVYKPTAWQRVKPGDRLWVRESFRFTSWDEDGDFRVTYEADKSESKWLIVNDGDASQSLIERLCAKLDRIGVQCNDVGYESTAALGITPCIHMPRWASRLTLCVTGVKVERLQDISAADAIAEGLIKLPATGRYVVERGAQYLGFADRNHKRVFEYLWDSIHGPGSWDVNPEVVAISFTVHNSNIDALPTTAVA